MKINLRYYYKILRSEDIIALLPPYDMKLICLLSLIIYYPVISYDWKLPKLSFKQISSPIILAFALASSPDMALSKMENTLLTARSVSKAEFLRATADGVAIDTRDKKAMRAEVNTLESQIGGENINKKIGSFETNKGLKEKNDFSDQLKLFQALKATQEQQKKSVDLLSETFLPFKIDMSMIIPSAIADERSVVTADSDNEVVPKITEQPQKYTKYGKIKQQRDVEETVGVEGAVRLVDNGGSRGARALASDGMQKGSLVDQLKQYGGPGDTKEKYVDKSLKNPFVYKEGIADQLSLYQRLQSK